MRRLHHLFNFLGELWSFARMHKAWWIVPIVLLLLLLSLLLVGVSTLSPFIYSLF